MIIDNKVVFEFEMNTKQVDNMQNITRKLKKEGGVLSKQKIEDCLNAVFLDLPEVEGHGTYGVFQDENSDNISLSLDSLPYRDLQRKIRERCMPSLKQKLTKEASKILDQYIETQLEKYRTRTQRRDAIINIILGMIFGGIIIALIKYFSGINIF